jgi:4-hydroxythreonine-4-phosphate dehydrogenase
MAAASPSPLVALTAGEPAGIGPDLCALIARERLPGRLVILGDARVIEERARLRSIPWDVPAYRDRDSAPQVSMLHLPAPAPVHAGRLDPANGRHVIALLDRAIDGCVSGEFDAMVTAPVQKSTINDAGIAFTGHTEYLAEKARAPHVVMMLVGGGLRVALATTHLPVSEIPRNITRESLRQTLRVIDADLKKRFRIARPRILVSGLNPHSGESGHLGREDIDVVAPAIAEAVAAGIAASGPIPADTLFVPERLKNADCALAMYHDQGLPVLKYASFGRGVNVTLGLPFVRTSVDHGTALDRAATGEVDAGSLREAVALAFELARPRG